MKEDKYKGCLMVSFDIPNWSFYLGNLIEPNDVYSEYKNGEEDKGIQLKTPHCTILYGIYNDVQQSDLLRYLLPLQSIPVKFGNITIFENNNFDVVKMDVKSEELNKINRNIINNIPYSSSYKVYKSHVTLGYVKKGTGQKYLRTNNKPFILYPNSYWFTNPVKGIDEHFEIYN
jgi:2'-5' RNA ligase